MQQPYFVFSNFIFIELPFILYSSGIIKLPEYPDDAAFSKFASVNVIEDLVSSFVSFRYTIIFAPLSYTKLLSSFKTLAISKTTL